ncbi:MAG: WG repeat-containing protein [Bacteroidota bacterium]
MNKIIFLLFLLTSFLEQLNAQFDFSKTKICDHGHICCQSGCSCCTERNRPQQYETILLKKVAHVNRKIVVERFQYAMNSSKYPVSISFQDEVNQSNETVTYYIPQLFYYIEFRPFSEGEKTNLDKLIEDYEKSGQILVVDKKDNYLLLNAKGEKIPFQMHSIAKISNEASIGGIRVINFNVFAFLDNDLNVLGEMRYQEIAPMFDCDFYLVRDFDRKYGLANPKGELVIPCIYSEIRSLGHNLFSVKEGIQISILNTKNFPISKEKYLGVDEFSEGLAEATNLKNEKMFIDTNGNVVFKHNYQLFRSFSNGLCSVMKDGKIGFINKKGELVIDYIFDRVQSFHKDVAPASIGTDSNKDKWGLIDQKGNFITEKKYDDFEQFKNGLARVFINGVGYGLIDTKGQEVFKPMYSISGYGTKNDYFIQDMLIRQTIGKSKSLEIVNRKEEQIIDLSAYVGANFVTNSKKPYSYWPYIVVYESDTVRNLIGFQGNKLLKNNYQLISIVSEDLALVKLKGKQKLIRISDEKTLVDFGDNKSAKFDGYFYEITNNGVLETYNLNGEKIKVYGIL